MSEEQVGTSHEPFRSPSVRPVWAGLSRIDPAVEGTGSYLQLKACVMSSTDHLNSEEDLRALKEGIPQAFTPGKTIFFRGGNLDQASFLQLVTTALAPYDSVNSLHMQLHQGVAARDAQEEAAAQFVRDAKASAIVSFGENSPEFSVMGFKAKKKAAPLTLEQKQLKQARIKATRKARGTMSRKQKEKIKGVVPTPEDSGPSPQSPAGTTPPKT